MISQEELERLKKILARTESPSGERERYGRYSDEEESIKFLPSLIAEVERLRRIEIAAWHSLDDSEDRGEDGALILREDFLRLDELLPERCPGERIERG